MSTKVEVLFARRMVELRGIHGLTQHDLALLTPNLDRPALSKIEAGIRGVSLSDALEIADALKVPLATMTTAGDLAVHVEVVTATINRKSQSLPA